MHSCTGVFLENSSPKIALSKCTFRGLPPYYKEYRPENYECIRPKKYRTFSHKENMKLSNSACKIMSQVRKIMLKQIAPVLFEYVLKSLE